MCHRRLLYHRVTVFTIYLSILFSFPSAFAFSLFMAAKWRQEIAWEWSAKKLADVKLWFFRRDLFMTCHKSQDKIIYYISARFACRKIAKKLDRSNQLLMTVTRNLFERVFEGFVRWCFTTCRSSRLTFQSRWHCDVDVIIADADECTFIVHF